MVKYLPPLAAGLLAAATFTTTLAPARADEAPVVVELFTSQGCSSCPPADVLLGDLARRADVIALGIHVDYWNYIGWTDPYATKLGTKRQKSYGRTLNQRYVYTPEIVVDGAAHDVGSDRAAVDKLIRDAKARAGARPSIAIERTATAGAIVHVGATPAPASSASATGPTTPATVWLVRFDEAQTTQVARGENAGRTLTNHHIVREFVELGTWTGTAADYPVADLTVTGDHGAVVLVQTNGVGPIVAAMALKPGF